MLRHWAWWTSTPHVMFRKSTLRKWRTSSASACRETPSRTGKSDVCLSFSSVRSCTHGSGIYGARCWEASTPAQVKDVLFSSLTSHWSTMQRRVRLLKRRDRWNDLHPPYRISWQEWTCDCLYYPSGWNVWGVFADAAGRDLVKSPEGGRCKEKCGAQTGKAEGIDQQED